MSKMWKDNDGQMDGWTDNGQTTENTPRHKLTWSKGSRSAYNDVQVHYSPCFGLDNNYNTIKDYTGLLFV